jgi:hypothetical protein
MMVVFAPIPALRPLITVNQLSNRNGALQGHSALEVLAKFRGESYEYQGWKIRAAFLQLDGPAVRMDYQKIAMTGVNRRFRITSFRQL